MIQFNLLPDVKLRYIKAERQKRLVMSIATIGIVTCIALLVILILIVNVMQTKNISDLGNDIDAAAQDMREIEDIDRVLTVQSQLMSLPAIHDNKVVSTRTFNFISSVTPAAVTIDSLIVDYDLQTIEISGAAPTLLDINTYADSLKFTTFQTSDDDSQQAAAFADVVLSSVSRQDDGATYTLTMTYDPAIYSSDANAQLRVPSIISSQPGVERPQPLFQSSGTEEQE